MLIFECSEEFVARYPGEGFFSLLSDEWSDVSKKEQVSFSVRTCTDEYEVCEDFVGILSARRAYHLMHC